MELDKRLMEKVGGFVVKGGKGREKKKQFPCQQTP
jgi:hypothetical protein